MKSSDIERKKGIVEQNVKLPDKEERSPALERVLEEQETKLISPSSSQEAVQEASPGSHENETTKVIPSPEAEVETVVGEPLRVEEPVIFVPSSSSEHHWSRWLPFLGIVVVGALLRFWGLGDKPLHHDESLHAYFSLQLLHNMQDWVSCFRGATTCYHYDPLLHGPFQFHFIALVYQISAWVQAPDQGVNTTTVRILAATLGTAMIGLPYFLRDYLGRWGAWLACFLVAVSPSMVYFSRFAREDIYMAFFTLLMVVAAGRYVRDRQLRWVVIGALAFSFSYATKEATFLTIAIFGSFLLGVLAWDLGLAFKRNASESSASPWRTGAPLLLGGYALIGGGLGLGLLIGMKQLSIYTTTHTKQSDAVVLLLKNYTVLLVLPVLILLLSLFILYKLWREATTSSLPGRRGLAARIDPRRQPLLDTFVATPWTFWVVALLAFAVVFVVLFTSLFTYIQGGIGDGIWQGLYYWLQQQQVARGSQPWYYYVMLLPLYEQVGLIFGFAGLVYSVLHPTRFRLFLVYWALGTLFIYTWAAEKMPWLMIHMMLPLLLLGGIALQPVARDLVTLAERWIQRPRERRRVAHPLLSPVGAFCGVLLLVLTLQNMYQVTYIHQADGPHEMMVYVQTTTDVNIVMHKIDALDRKLYGGKHQLHIGLIDDATWPYAWYLRDYTNVCFRYPQGCTTPQNRLEVILAGGDDLVKWQSAYANPQTGGYLFHEYRLRSWWSEGYKPAPDPKHPVDAAPGSAAINGLGLGTWLSYGDTKPAGTAMNPVLTGSNIWNWWWERRPIGSTDGSYGMGLFIHKGLPITP